MSYLVLVLLTLFAALYLFVVLRLIYDIIILPIWEILKHINIPKRVSQKKASSFVANVPQEQVIVDPLLPHKINDLQKVLECSQEKYNRLEHPIEESNSQNQMFVYDIYLDKLYALKTEVDHHGKSYDQYKSDFYQLIKHSSNNMLHDDSAIALDNILQVLQKTRRSIEGTIIQIHQKIETLEKQQLKKTYQEIISEFNKNTVKTSVWASYSTPEDEVFWNNYEQMIAKMKYLRNFTIQMAS
ncbi:hypothetical protein BKI52_44155 [marine bacterium AO1-C]|nr:hypothetical protein BKI52_44155 [marine bacterium AO1-C]